MAYISDFTHRENIDTKPITDPELAVLLERARSLYARMRELELAEYNLTPEQAAVLHAIESKGGSATSEEIANVIIRQYHSVVAIVNRMVKIGYLSREKTQNRRSYLICLTEKGKNAYNNIPRNAVKMLFSNLTPTEKRDLALNLQKVISKGRESLALDYRLPFLTNNL
jgi:DNA-binding MarR family transcriptional regulator